VNAAAPAAKARRLTFLQMEAALMTDNARKLRSLEALGYIAAFMIALGGLTDSKALDYFNILGLVFAIIVIIRLMVMNVSLGLVQQIYDAPGIEAEDTPVEE
jgi:hypothetical protein